MPVPLEWRVSRSHAQGKSPWPGKEKRKCEGCLKKVFAFLNLKGSDMNKVGVLTIMQVRIETSKYYLVVRLFLFYFLFVFLSFTTFFNNPLFPLVHGLGRTHILISLIHWLWVFTNL